MIAFDDVGRHELVKQSRNSLNADETTSKAGHHNQASSLSRPFGLLEIFLGLR
jgi:hypothetical protein